MKPPRTTTATLVGSLVVACALLSGPLYAKDAYKGFLDASVPHHRAILDTLSRIEAAPDDPGLHNDLGCLLVFDGFWKDALAEFETAAKLAGKPDKNATFDLEHSGSKPHFNAGLVHAVGGSWGAARHSFSKALGYDKSNWTAWWMLGLTEERLGNLNAAVAAYKKSLRVDNALFDVAKNPFAAQSALKWRVLLETYPQRLARAGLPYAEQYADAARLAPFFQRARPAAPAAEDASAEPAQSGGPVFTTIPAGGSPSPGRGGGTVSTRTAQPRPPFEQFAPLAQPQPEERRIPVAGPGGSDEPPTAPQPQQGQPQQPQPPPPPQAGPGGG
jgi:hypothetical protein